ncbi:MAG: hypothetical protein R6V46_04115 [Desulfatiglandaceae bacterium]
MSGDERGVSRPLLLHIRMVTELVEGRRVAMEDIFRMVDRILRQLSMDKEKRSPYGRLAWPKRSP